MKKYFVSLLLICSFLNAVNAQNRIFVSLHKALQGPYTGRLFVYTQKDTTKPFSLNFSYDGAAYSTEVKNWVYGQTLEVPQNADALNEKLTGISPGFYKLIAILDTNKNERGKSAPGNLYTRHEMIWQVSEGKENRVELQLTHAFPVQSFNENDSVREINFKSDILTRFKGYPVNMQAAVVLPRGYRNDSLAIYPVMYIIPGYGGTHHQALSAVARKKYGTGVGKEMIYVFLNPEAPGAYGPHAYVDSRVNGPWGNALINELMPFIQKHYRGSSNPRLNFLTGQSTGGYGVVWLAMNYPGKFGGVWATAPDPLDFSNFIGVNLYKEDNFFTDTKNEERGFNKMNGIFNTTLRKYFRQEQFDADGGQLQAFEAEFGKPNEQGLPYQLFNSVTGTINKPVVKIWQPYDMALFVQSKWRSLKKQLNYPVRIYVGASDNFLLNTAALSFAEKIRKFNLSVYVQEIPGADHFQVRTEELAVSIKSEIDELITGVNQ